MMEHQLKTLPEYFAAVAAGRKTLEVRRDDRPFTEGDTLLLEEWDGSSYTGHTVRVAVAYVLRGEYCRDGYCVMSIKPVSRTHGDLFRRMSDEELAVTLMCPNEMGMAEIPCDHSDGKNCCQCLLDWLRQPEECD